MSEPTGLAISGSDLFVSNYNTGTIGEYTTSGSPVAPNFITGVTPNGPDALTFLGGNLYVANYGNGGSGSGFVSEYSPLGVPIGNPLITGLNGPFGIASDGTNLYVSNFLGNTIGKYSAAGSLLNTFSVPNNQGPTGMAFSGGNIYVAEYVPGTIDEYSTNGALLQTGLVTGLDGPDALAIYTRHLPQQRRLRISRQPRNHRRRIHPRRLAGQHRPHHRLESAPVGIVVVPEPATASLLLISTAGLLDPQAPQ